LRLAKAVMRISPDYFDACVEITRKSSDFTHPNLFKFQNLRISSKTRFKSVGPRYAFTKIAG
jgi:hypothetical protein